MTKSLDFKQRVENSILKYHKKQYEEQNKTGPTRRNKAPEKSTEAAVRRWGRENGFEFHVVDSSRYQRSLDELGDSKAEIGFSDIVGNSMTGLACYIELKAKGRRHNLSDTQREFLIKKINSSCFAVVVDSDARLEKYWKTFCSLKTPKERKAFLLDCLPGQYNTEKRRKAQEKEKVFSF